MSVLLDAPYPLDRDRIERFRRDGFIRLKDVFDGVTHVFCIPSFVMGFGKLDDWPCALIVEYLFLFLQSSLL